MLENVSLEAITVHKSVWSYLEDLNVVVSMGMSYKKMESLVKVQRTKYVSMKQSAVFFKNQILMNAHKTHQDVVKVVGTPLEASFVHVMMGIDCIMRI